MKAIALYRITYLERGTRTLAYPGEAVKCEGYPETSDPFGSDQHVSVTRNGVEVVTSSCNVFPSDKVHNIEEVGEAKFQDISVGGIRFILIDYNDKIDYDHLLMIKREEEMVICRVTHLHEGVLYQGDRALQLVGFELL